MNLLQSIAGTPLRAALTIGAVAFATIAGAWIFEWAGYAPCELCLQQRYAYYAGIPLAMMVALGAALGAPGASRVLLIVLALLFAGSAMFGVYHSGVEWGFWPGPSGCSGAATGAPKAGPTDMGAFLQQLKTSRVVPCTEAAIRIFGLSLAGWNALISTALSAVAIAGFRRN